MTKDVWKKNKLHDVASPKVDWHVISPVSRRRSKNQARSVIIFYQRQRDANGADDCPSNTEGELAKPLKTWRTASLVKLS